MQCFELYGNYTVDIIQVNNVVYGTRIGGGVYYSAIPLIKSGHTVFVHTTRTPWHNSSYHGEINVYEQSSSRANIFKLVYTSDKRMLYVIDKAPPLPITLSVHGCDISILNPVLGEITLPLTRKIRANTKILAIDIQGFLRTIKDGEIILYQNPSAHDIVELSDIVHLDIEEAQVLANATILNEVIKKLGTISRRTIFLVTRNEKPPIIIHGNEYWIPNIIEEKVNETTGSGDFFLSAFILEYLKTYDTKRSVVQAISATTKWLKEKNASSRPTAPEPPPPNP